MEAMNRSLIKTTIKQQTPRFTGCLLLVLSLVAVPYTFAASKYEIKPESLTTQVGQLETVQIWLTTDQQVGATDFQAFYSTEFLEVVSIEKGNIFDDYPALKYQNDIGRIALAGINTDRTKTFTGTGLYASITFRAKKDGQAQININYTPGSTEDSNIVPRAQKIEDIRDDLNAGGSMLFQIGNFEDKPIVEPSIAPATTPVTAVPVAEVQENNLQQETSSQETKAVGGGVINSFTKFFRSFFSGGETESTTSNTNSNSVGSESNTTTTTTDSGTEIIAQSETAANEPKKFRITDQPITDQTTSTNPSQSETAKTEEKSSRLLYIVTLILLIATGVGGYVYAKKRNLFNKKPHNLPPQPPIVKL